MWPPDIGWVVMFLHKFGGDQVSSETLIRAPAAAPKLSRSETRTSVLSVHGANEGPKEMDILVSERLFNKGKFVAAAPDDPAPTSALQRRQARGSDGEASGERPQRLASSSAHREVTMQSAKEAAGAPGNSPVLRFFPKPLSLFPAL